jgi:capsid protein
MYKFTETIPIRDEQGLARFLLCVNPITFDDVRGRTVFKNTLRNIRYLENIRDFELQALEWASSQSGVYYTKTGQLPDSPFEPDGTGDDEAEGYGLPQVSEPVVTMRVRPNTIQALGIGEDVKMFQHDRPSPNVVAMYRETVKDIALGVGVSFAFAYDMSGMLGGAVRSASNQDKRALQTWKEGLREDFLDVVSTLLLMDGIQDGDIAPHPLAFNGVWQFPAHPTIDVGRESSADINERQALLKSGAMIAGEYGEDIDDIRRDCTAETEADLAAAMEISERVFERTGERVPWRECLSFLKPGGAIQMSPQFEAARAEQLDAAASAAAESANRNADLASGPGTVME